MLTSGAFGYIADYVLWWVLYLSLIAHTWCFFRFFPRQRRRRSALVLGNVLVFFCLLATAAMIGESYFRFLAVHTDSFGVSLPARRWFALYTDLNSLGCRDKEWTADKPAAVRRIAFVGDSFTYGWGIKDPADRFTGRLQKRFDAVAPGSVEVMNVAKPGWSTKDELARLGDLIERYDMDEVVLCYVINDIEDLIPTEASFNPTRPPEPKLFNPDSSCLLDYLYRRLYLPRVPSVRGYFEWLVHGYDDPTVWSTQEARLKQMADICSRKEVRFRVALLPYVAWNGADAARDEINARLTAFFRSNGIEALDLAPAISLEPPRTLVVNALDAHPNQRAHALFADALWLHFYQSRAP